MKKSLHKEVKPYVPSCFDERKEASQVSTSNEIAKEEEIKNYEETIKEQIERGYRTGYEEGFKKGYEEGLKKAEAEINEKILKLQKAEELFLKTAEELSRLKEQQIKNLIPHILKLSLKIAEKIIAQKIEMEKEFIFPIIKEALSFISLEEEKVVIKLNPEDYQLVRDNISRLNIDYERVHLEPSNDITKGSCQIETQTTMVESKIEEKLKEIENALNRILP